MAPDSAAMIARRLTQLMRAAARLTVQTALGGDCPVCGDPMGDHEAGVCAHCWREAARASGGRQDLRGGHISTLTVLGAYEGRLREIIHCFKYGDRPELAGPLGDRLAEGLTAPGGVLAGVDMVVAVPLHWRRRLRRGYNQSAQLARRVARGTARPLLGAALLRVRHTPPQTGASRRGRLANVRGAFRVRTPWLRRNRLAGASILLVDDVVTTGATLREAARALKAGGASHVHGAALARVMQPLIR